MSDDKNVIQITRIVHDSKNIKDSKDSKDNGRREVVSSQDSKDRKKGIKI